MKRLTIPTALAVAVALVAAVWLPGASLGRSTTASSPAVVKVAYNKKLKTQILVTGAGFTLYLSTDDLGGKPSCYDDPATHCAQAWPPYRSAGQPIAGKGVNAAWLKTDPRTDGVPQVAYRGHPLYTDAGALSELGLKPDKKPGDVNGQNVFGWYAVSPTGKAVH